jgi:hypothetical protein
MNRSRSFIIIFLLLLLALFRHVIFTLNSIAGNYGDVFLHYYPLKYLVTEHLIKGEIPFWNPYIFAGHPILANPQSALFYPISVLFYFFPLHIAFNYFYLLHFMLAGLFFFLFLTSSGFSRTACFFGSIAFAFSSFFIYTVPAGHPAALSGYVWLPLIMLFLGKLGKRPGAIAPQAALAAALSFQFLSGHFQPIYCAIVIIVIHFTFSGFRYWKQLLAVSAAAVVLSACQIIPTLELSQVIEKSFWPGLVSNYSMQLKNLITIIFPNHFGNIIDGNHIFQENCSYFFERQALYFGLIPALFALAGIYLALKKKEYFMPLLLVLSVTLATGIYLRSDVLYQHVPGLNFLRVPARFYVIALLAMIILACTAWDHFLAGPDTRYRSWAKVLLMGFLVADLYIWDSKFIFAQDMGNYRKSALPAAVTEPLYRIATEPDKIPSNRSMLYHQYNLNGYEAFFLENFVKYVGLQEKRVFNATSLARIDLLSPLSRGLSVGYYFSSARIPDSTVVAGLPNGILVQKAAGALPRVYLSRRAIVIPDSQVYAQLDHLITTRYSPDKEIIIGKIPQGAPSLTKSGRVISYESGTGKVSAEVDLPAGGIVVFSEIFYPGWKAWAGGRQILVCPVNKALRAVFLPPGNYTGKNRVTTLMRPVSWFFGLYLTVFALIISLLLLVFPRILTFIMNIDMILKS